MDRIFNNGDKVYLKKEYEDKPGEKFIVSQIDYDKKRCWIGDKNGSGWFVSFHQIQKNKPQ